VSRVLRSNDVTVVISVIAIHVLTSAAIRAKGVYACFPEGGVHSGSSDELLPA
jgi:hypothetical protein